MCSQNVILRKMPDPEIQWWVYNYYLITYSDCAPNIISPLGGVRYWYRGRITENFVSSQWLSIQEPYTLCDRHTLEAKYCLSKVKCIIGSKDRGSQMACTESTKLPKSLSFLPSTRCTIHSADSTWLNSKLKRKLDINTGEKDINSNTVRSKNHTGALP